jgi:Sugar (and other) transporter
MIVPVLTQWVANAIVVPLFPAGLHQLGQARTFGFLAFVSLLQSAFRRRYIPETKTRRLEEIEEFWVQRAKQEGGIELWRRE